MNNDTHSPFIAITIFAGFLLAATSCVVPDAYTGEAKYSRSTIGGGTGAAVGAIAGAIIGNNTGDRDAGRGAVIGAVAGGLGGAAIGNYMDRQEAAIRAELRGTGVGVQRHGDNLILIMPGNITFSVDRDEVRSGFYPVLNSVGTVLRKFDRTMVGVNGFTDSSGSSAYNQDLSRRRAISVSNYLVGQGVNFRRLVAQGFGERSPVASNATEQGRASNRRVEIHIVPQ